MESLLAVLSTVRGGGQVGRSDIARQVGLGRAVIGERVDQLLDLKLLQEAGLGGSTGGRRALELELAKNKGVLLLADLGATSIAVGLADLDGTILDFEEEEARISDGPEIILGSVAHIFKRMLHRYDRAAPLWAIGVGVPGPVEFATGTTVSPPIMPGWDGFSVRNYFQSRFHAVTWVDNDVNLMALAEARVGIARDALDSIFVKVGTGIGVGLVSQRSLHRGSQGSAGDIGHISITDSPTIICACGNTGCLEAVAGGGAIGRAGQLILDSHNSSKLEALVESPGEVSARDVAQAAASGDLECMKLIVDAGRTLGTALAGLINFFNPNLIVIGGGVAQAGTQYLASVREAVYRRAAPLATRDLAILPASLGAQVGVIGGAHMVMEELLNPAMFRSWIASGSPNGIML